MTTPISPIRPTKPISPANGVLTRPIDSSQAGMDRKIAKRRFTPQHIVMVLGGLLLVALTLYLLLGRDGRQRLTAEVDRLTISTVEVAAFQEYVAVNGSVQPGRTVYLDAVVGGQIAQRLVNEGDMVIAGQPLLVFNNDNLTLQMMSSEAQMQEQISSIRSQRLALDQNALNLSQQLVQLDYDITRLGRERERIRELAERGFASQQELDRVNDEYEYTVRRRELTEESHRQDMVSRELQLQQMEDALVRLERNLGLVRETMRNLTVVAPVDGQLTAFNAEVGEAKGASARLGQIDVLDQFNVRVPVDEHYITRVGPGQIARTTVDGREYELTVNVVYPEVRDGRFEIDLAFIGEPPSTIRRGQTLRLRLELGDPEQATLLARGGFFQSSGGNWAYVLSEDGSFAERRPIRLGRQNPQFYEVIEGLRPGDRVVTSSYETFGNAEVLILR